MVTTMDRYEADWRIVERGWNAHVHGQARAFRSAREAIETFRAETPGTIDQFLPAFVIVDEKGAPVGPIRDGAAVVFFNFRGDRAIEISRAFEQEDFPYFDRGARPQVDYAGMMQYDGDFQIPTRLSRRAARDRPHPGRVPGPKRRHPVRLQRDAEVRPCDLLLERQPRREVRRERPRPTSRSPRTACRSSSAPG